MKVQITATVEVDQEAWAAEYGLDKAEVREDVKEYFAQSLGDCHAVQIGLASITRRGA